jgi:uncharacterized protein YggE
MKFLSALCVLFALCVPSLAGEINVAGEGTVKLAPDIATVSLAVVTESKSVSDSMSLNNTAASKLYDKLASYNIDKKDVQTTELSVQANYDNNGRPTGTYSVINGFSVTLRNLSKLGTVLDGLTTDNTTRLGGLHFGNSNTSAATVAARTLAVANARAKAVELARLSGLYCGKATHITESSYSHNPYADGVRCAAPGGGGTPISGGQLTVSVSVSISYELVDTDTKRNNTPTQTLPLFPQD